MANSKHIINSFRDESARLFFLSFGVFLFILFFQPFPLGRLDYENRLLFVTGFGAINFLISWVILIMLPVTVPRWFKYREWETGPSFITVVLLVIFTATAFSFYIRYVGKVPLSFYIMFKIFLVCLLPLIILWILYRNKAMELEIKAMQDQINYFIEEGRKKEKIEEGREITLDSDNKSDNLTLLYRNIVYVKSADNYIEINYLENGTMSRKLLRNTLKKIEFQLASHKSFIRSHRTCIVNLNYMVKIERDYSGYHLALSCSDEKLSVSRQYLVQLREALSAKK